ncbi:Rrf2 family transcriptional regulator [Reichenbachiella carrageenanivorans]|uniref:Rrf2 family transcriptional regulator n=1 Tax=Reichenbachiella carrageenanivorans TaxID=2979869 RepID=A0ABY6CYN6_9BACT|nr:Rrf2 family transcriptional regulator [Reichenbachiella carrageenanivorans]UXX79036.1 Rrf2 family transcriptional regulator [Reichenbachiella carrageenanivorans]
MFSKACMYGIRASIYVSSQSLKDNKVGLIDIANNIESPTAFTAKVLQQLVRSGIIDSTKGPTGGFLIDPKRIDEVKLSQIVDAIDGDSIYKGCGLGLTACDASQPCPVHEQFAKVRNELRHMLESTSLYELATGLDIGLTYLKR